jgi:hypothetical protein
MTVAPEHAELNEQLNAYLDGGLEEPTRWRLAGHLAVCEVCREELAQLDQTRAALRALPTLRAPRPFTIPVPVASGPAPRSVFPWLAWVWRFGSLATAACLLLAMVSAFLPPATPGGADAGVFFGPQPAMSDPSASQRVAQPALRSAAESPPPTGGAGGATTGGQAPGGIAPRPNAPEGAAPAPDQPADTTLAEPAPAASPAPAATQVPGTESATGRPAEAGGAPVAPGGAPGGAPGAEDRLAASRPANQPGEVSGFEKQADGAAGPAGGGILVAGEVWPASALWLTLALLLGLVSAVSFAVDRRRRAGAR